MKSTVDAKVKNSFRFLHKRSADGQKRGKLTPITSLLLLVLVIYTLSMFLLLGWGVITSFKSQEDYYLNTYKLPEKWLISNYIDISKEFYVKVHRRPVLLPEMFFNSILYAVGTALMQALSACIVAYMCARFKYRFYKVLYAVVLITMMLPLIGTLPSEIKLAKTLRLYDEMWGIWIMSFNFLGTYFLIFHAAFRSIPITYAEAAKIDGASNLTVMLRIYFPLAKTTFFTCFLIEFIGRWNGYTVPLVFVPSYPTISYGLFEVTSSKENSMTDPMRMAAAVILMIPVMLLFLAFHKRMLGNLSLGGIKE